MKTRILILALVIGSLFTGDLYAANRELPMIDIEKTKQQGSPLHVSPENESKGELQKYGISGNNFRTFVEVCKSLNISAEDGLNLSIQFLKTKVK